MSDELSKPQREMYLEERIRDHFNIRILVEKRSRCDYHVSPEDFEGIAQRTGARIEYVPANDIDGLVSHMTLYMTAGKTRVYPDKEIERGRFGVWEPCQASDARGGIDAPKVPALADRVSEQLLEGAIKACRVQNWPDAVQLVRTFIELHDRKRAFGL